METSRDKLKNLLAILLEAISSQSDEYGLDVAWFREMCMAAGYHDSDISGILAWAQAQWPAVGDLTLTQDLPGDPASPGGIRLFSEDEREYLTPGALGYLLELLREAQITPSQLEILIHHASLVLDLPLRRQDIDSLLDRVIFGSPGPEPLDLPADTDGTVH